MAKDPAINWYFDNWTGGTKTMSRFLKGCYMDLLDAQFHSGHLSLDEIKYVLGSDFSAWQTLQKKFKQDENGNYFNERMELEIVKRKLYSDSRRNNRKKTCDEDMKNISTNISNSYEHINGIETEIKTGTSFEKSEKLFFDLTKIEIQNTAEYLDRVAQRQYSEDDLKNFWQAFKLQYSNDFYYSRSKIIQHFKDWLKKQSFPGNDNGKRMIL